MERPPIRRVAIAGFVIFALFFGVLVGWAAVAKLESAAVAQGIVAVESKRKTVQHLEGGIVREILVRDGDRVEAGQPLLRLDRTQAEATLKLMKGRHRALAALESRLKTERDNTDAVTFPNWLNSAAAADSETADILRGQIGIFEARREEQRTQVRILRQRTAQLLEEIRGLSEQISAADRQLALITEEIQDVGSLVEKGLERKPRLLALQRQMAEIEGNRGRDIAGIARAKQQIAEAELRVSELRVTMVNDVVGELQETQTNLFDIAQRISAAEDILRRTEITAPIQGTVVSSKVHTPGGVIGPGEALMEIVPSRDLLMIEAQVDPSDIDVVHAGLPAKVRITAFKSRNLLPLDGSVVSVSADRLSDPNTGQSFFLARVSLDGDPSKQLLGAPLHPGMQAEVMIVTGARTALDYLFRPLLLSIDRSLREN